MKSIITACFMFKGRSSRERELMNKYYVSRALLKEAVEFIDVYRQIAEMGKIADANISADFLARAEGIL